jgi:uncharacterized membrane protein
LAEIKRTIEVNLPLNVVYKAWTEFKDYPQFMEGVEEVSARRDGQLHWVTNIDGHRRESESQVTELVPNKKIAWHSTGGGFRDVEICFSTVGPERTRVETRVHYEPTGPSEMVGDWLGVVSSRIQGDLTRFRDHIERAGQEEGAWRGGMGLHSTQQPMQKAS